MRSSLGLSLERQGKKLVNKWIAMKRLLQSETPATTWWIQWDHTELSFQKRPCFDQQVTNTLDYCPVGWYFLHIHI